SMEMGGGDDEDKGAGGSEISQMPDGEMPQMPDGEIPQMPDGEMPQMHDGEMPDIKEGFPEGDFNPEDIDFSKMKPPTDFDGKMPGMGDFKPDDADQADQTEGSEKQSRKGGPGGGFGGSGGRGGADLNYTDDDLDSYSTIWDGTITETSKADHKRVVEALKNISEGNDLEKYMDVDNILKYMAVHTFSVNMDSLSGSMAHNYYLYEYDGQLNIFPWDYNLSLGGMSMGSDGDATDMVNDAIDTPYAGTEFFDALLENEEYLEKYHEYLRQLTEEYVYGGRFDEVYTRIRSQIDDLVKEDPTAFYSYDEYTAAADMLYETIMLRAKSIIGQLDGTIPSTDEEQSNDSSAFIDASNIDTDVMGKFDMGGMGGQNGDNDGRGERRGGRAPKDMKKDKETE
ncbi:MAG: CotH kinase family protein, partial [Lachnospiraceae bacterium]|nr:CotH kinase family protein [Lachnospiraceae bacterium]